MSEASQEVKLAVLQTEMGQVKTSQAEMKDDMKSIKQAVEGLEGSLSKYHNKLALIVGIFMAVIVIINALPHVREIGKMLFG